MLIRISILCIELCFSSDTHSEKIQKRQEWGRGDGGRWIGERIHAAKLFFFSLWESSDLGFSLHEPLILPIQQFYPVLSGVEEGGCKAAHPPSWGCRNERGYRGNPAGGAHVSKMQSAHVKSSEENWS